MVWNWLFDEEPDGGLHPFIGIPMIAFFVFAIGAAGCTTEAQRRSTAISEAQHRLDAVAAGDAEVTDCYWVNPERTSASNYGIYSCMVRSTTAVRVDGVTIAEGHAAYCFDIPAADTVDPRTAEPTLHGPDRPSTHCLGEAILPSGDLGR
jgi:hypothetical protein